MESKKEKLRMPEEIAAIIRKLRTDFPNSQYSVVLYGSQTRQTADAKSDYDINVIKKYDHNLPPIEFQNEYDSFSKQVLEYMRYNFPNVSQKPVNPTFQVKGKNITIVPKISYRQEKSKLFFAATNKKIIENNPNLAIRITNEKDKTTNGEYRKTVIYLKERLRKFGFSEGGFMIENLLHSVPDHLFMNRNLSKRLLLIFKFLKKELKSRSFESWKKMDRDENAFVSDYKYQGIKKYVNRIIWYLTLFG